MRRGAPLTAGCARLTAGREAYGGAREAYGAGRMTMGCDVDRPPSTAMAWPLT
jgi:hypothetical protein